MKITLLAIGKTEQPYLVTGIDAYCNRLKHYTSFSLEIIPALKNNKNMSELEQKQREGELLLAQMKSTDWVVLLDENGAQPTSVQFSELLQKRMLASVKNLVFVIGGPYGFSAEMYARANEKMSLSPMTFSHQMVRLIFVEQLYRAFTIIKGEPYHHK
jgi:23S rRNA (pseudouridine1915-N3)-methyltransferase